MKNRKKLSNDEPFIGFPIPVGTQEINENNHKVEDYSLPEQGKLTRKEQLLIKKYKDIGIDFSDLLKTWKKIEKEYKKKYLNNKKKS